MPSDMERGMRPVWNLISGLTVHKIKTESGTQTAPKPGDNTNMESGL